MNVAENHIVKNLNIMNGKPVIKDTRITVELILRKLSEGVTVSEFQEMYPHITEVQIFAALELVVDLIGEQVPLTNEEQKALSDFFKKRKMESKIESKSVRNTNGEKPFLK